MRTQDERDRQTVAIAAILLRVAGLLAVLVVAAVLVELLAG